MFAKMTTRNRHYFIIIFISLVGCVVVPVPGSGSELQQTTPDATITLAALSPVTMEVSTATPFLPTEIPTQTPSAEPSGTPTAVPQETQTLTTSKSCQPSQNQAQTVLQAAIPKKFWGLHYQTNGVHPPSMEFFGVISGETKTSTVEDQPGNSESIDLARMYFLNVDGSLDSLWVA
jgi:hypothetical protein